MNRTGNGAALCEDPHDFLVMQNLYDAAVRQLTLKFNILNSEFNVLYARNPIHHIDGRVKSQSSIVAKLIKRGLPLSIDSARKNINDIAGVRVVCSYIDDVYRVGEMLARQTDVEIVKKQDYIQTPNYNGYRSLHMDIKVPVYLSDRTEYVVAEIQLRTIAMDFWASLEHDIRYKVDKTKLPEGINEEMFECAGKIAEIDRQMQDMYQRIKIVEPQHLHQRADAAGREARLVAAAVLVLEKVHVPRIGVAVARAQLRRRLHALDVLGRELFLSARAAESLHRRRHHRRGVVVRQRFDVRPLRHAQDKRGEHRAVDDVHFEAVAPVKFRQLRDDLAIFLFGTRRNVLRLLRGQVEFDRQVLFKRSGKQRPHARRLSKILHLLSPFRV